MSIQQFRKEFIGRIVQDHLPLGFIVRPLENTDFDKQVLTTLSHLTTVGGFSRADYLIIEDTKNQTISAAGTLFIERKIIHSAGLVGHIEDIVVHKDYRKLKLGKFIIEQLKFIGEQNGCYKIILDCSEKNVGFYEKSGFTRKEVTMALYMEQNEAKL